MIYLSHDQITFVFEAILGMLPRAADLALLDLLGCDTDTVADYIWDHMLGEPDSPTRDDVLAQIQTLIEEPQP